MKRFDKILRDINYNYNVSAKKCLKHKEAHRSKIDLCASLYKERRSI